MRKLLGALYRLFGILMPCYGSFWIIPGAVHDFWTNSAIGNGNGSCILDKTDMWHIPPRGVTTSRRCTNIVLYFSMWRIWMKVVRPCRSERTPPKGRLELQENPLPPLSQFSLCNTALLNIAPIIESMTSGQSTAINVATHLCKYTLKDLKDRIHCISYLPLITNRLNPI